MKYLILCLFLILPISVSAVEIPRTEFEAQNRLKMSNNGGFLPLPNNPFAVLPLKCAGAEPIILLAKTDVGYDVRACRGFSYAVCRDEEHHEAFVAPHALNKRLGFAVGNVVLGSLANLPPLLLPE